MSQQCWFLSSPASYFRLVAWLEIIIMTVVQLRYVVHQFVFGRDYLIWILVFPTSTYSQLIVGLLFLIISGMDINDLKSKSSANILNNVILGLVFVITLINAVISGFGIKHTDTSVQIALNRWTVSEYWIKFWLSVVRFSSSSFNKYFPAFTRDIWGSSSWPFQHLQCYVLSFKRLKLKLKYFYRRKVWGEWTLLAISPSLPVPIQISLVSKILKSWRSIWGESICHISPPSSLLSTPALAEASSSPFYDKWMRGWVELIRTREPLKIHWENMFYFIVIVRTEHMHAKTNISNS